MRSELVRGAGGIFEVRLDGRLLFSKRQAGRFPEAGEVEGLLESSLPADPGGG
jgi:selenoprotein W-related protein